MERRARFVSKYLTFVFFFLLLSLSPSLSLPLSMLDFNVDILIYYGLRPV